MPTEVQRDERVTGTAYRPLYRVWCLPSHEWQRARLEALRARFGGYRRPAGVLQRLGDVGRWLIGKRIR